MVKNIKKGKIALTITIGIAVFALALVMSMQFKIINEADIASIESMREAELRTELANWKSKYEETNEQYNETMKKIEEYKKTKQSNEETEKLVDDELRQVNSVLGKTDVVGEGIIITLQNSKDSEISNINSDDLLMIVNSLKTEGVEAISVNNERIINMTDIVDINNSFIKINGQRIVAPYTIKAIGNQVYLESALVGNGGYVDELKKLGHSVSIEKSNRVEINKYDDDLRIKYMN